MLNITKKIREDGHPCIAKLKLVMAHVTKMLEWKLKFY